MLNLTPTDTLLKPVTIGNLVIDPPLSLAPMAGQTNHAFRTLCRDEGGCGLVCTELISSKAMQYKSSRSKTFQMFDWRPDESPFAVQLFGSDPAVMADAARLVVDHGAPMVDINMGCWVPKITKKNGGGAALLKDVCTATAVVAAVVEAVDVPVTVKVRSGWTADNPTAVEFAQAAERVGVAAIAVHARFADQGFTGVADWSWIRRVKDVVSIPVFGNGDITCADDVRRMMTETGCDGVMIGRAALGNPWLFRDIMHELRTGETPPEPTIAERAAMALKQARLTLETTKMPPIKAIRELRGQLIKYVYGLHDATTIRDGIVSAESLADLEAVLLPLAEGEYETAS